jgi:hypothetical protein
MLAESVLPWIRPVSRRRFVRLAGDLIEACVPCPTHALSRPVDHLDDKEVGQRADTYLAMLHLACALITWRAAEWGRLPG